MDMTFDFPTLIAHAAETRPLAAGAIVGSGTVSNKDRSAGSSCLAEKRMLETIEEGGAKTPRTAPASSAPSSRRCGRTRTGSSVLVQNVTINRLWYGVLMAPCGLAAEARAMSRRLVQG